MCVSVECTHSACQKQVNKQGDVQAMEFGIPGYNDLVWDVSLASNRIGSSTQHGLYGNLKLQLGDYSCGQITLVILEAGRKFSFEIKKHENPIIVWNYLSTIGFFCEVKIAFIIARKEIM